MELWDARCLSTSLVYELEEQQLARPAALGLHIPSLRQLQKRVTITLAPPPDDFTGAEPSIITYAPQGRGPGGGVKGVQASGAPSGSGSDEDLSDLSEISDLDDYADFGDDGADNVARRMQGPGTPSTRAWQWKGKRHSSAWDRAAELGLRSQALMPMTLVSHAVPGSGQPVAAMQGVSHGAGGPEDVRMGLDTGGGNAGAGASTSLLKGVHQTHATKGGEKEDGGGTGAGTSGTRHHAAIAWQTELEMWTSDRPLGLIASLRGESLPPRCTTHHTSLPRAIRRACLAPQPTNPLPPPPLAPGYSLAPVPTDTLLASLHQHGMLTETGVQRLMECQAALSSSVKAEGAGPGWFDRLVTRLRALMLSCDLSDKTTEQVLQALTDVQGSRPTNNRNSSNTPSSPQLCAVLTHVLRQHSASTQLQAHIHTLPPSLPIHPAPPKPHIAAHALEQAPHPPNNRSNALQRAGSTTALVPPAKKLVGAVRRWLEDLGAGVGRPAMAQRPGTHTPGRPGSVPRGILTRDRTPHTHPGGDLNQGEGNRLLSDGSQQDSDVDMSVRPRKRVRWDLAETDQTVQQEHEGHDGVDGQVGSIGQVARGHQVMVRQLGLPGEGREGGGRLDRRVLGAAAVGGVRLAMSVAQVLAARHVKKLMQSGEVTVGEHHTIKGWLTGSWRKDRQLLTLLSDAYHPMLTLQSRPPRQPPTSDAHVAKAGDGRSDAQAVAQAAARPGMGVDGDVGVRTGIIQHTSSHDQHLQGDVHEPQQVQQPLNDRGGGPSGIATGGLQEALPVEQHQQGQGQGQGQEQCQGQEQGQGQGQGQPSVLSSRASEPVSWRLSPAFLLDAGLLAVQQLRYPWEKPLQSPQPRTSSSSFPPYHQPPTAPNDTYLHHRPLGTRASAVPHAAPTGVRTSGSSAQMLRPRPQLGPVPFFTAARLLPYNTALCAASAERMQVHLAHDVSGEAAVRAWGGALNEGGMEAAIMRGIWRRWRQETGPEQQQGGGGGGAG